jgi:hypothetical protein
MMRVIGFRVADVKRERTTKVTKAPQIYPQPGEILMTIKMTMWRRLQSKN